MKYEIRHLEPEDAAAIYEIISHDSVISGTLHVPYAPMEMVENRRKQSEGGRRLVALADGVVVGTISLDVFQRPRRRHAGAIGMMVHEDWQGRGVGTALMEAVCDYADNWLNLERIELDVFVDNAAAIRLYEKFGFEIEGTLRNYAWRNGAYVDGHYMARLKSRLD